MPSASVIIYVIPSGFNSSKNLVSSVLPILMEYTYTKLNSFNNKTLHCFLQMGRGSLVPRPSPRANKKSKERGEPGRIYHVRNVISRENLITCGRTNEPSHAVDSTTRIHLRFMADRMGLDGTMLHYLAVRKAMVSVHKHVYSKMTLTYSLPGKLTVALPVERFFKALLNAKGPQRVLLKLW